MRARIFPVPSLAPSDVELFDACSVRLSELAARAKAKGYTGRTAMVVCFAVDRWPFPELLDHLMPGHEPVRDEGLGPVALGYVTPRQVAADAFSIVAPTLASRLRLPPPSPRFHVFVGTDTAGLFWVEPKGEAS